jgi:hypothetical protein
MGEAAPDLLVDERLRAGLDLSLFREGEQRRFVAARRRDAAAARGGERRGRNPATPDRILVD